MSLSTLVQKIQYSPNGITTDFAFPYLFLDNNHLVVIITDASNIDTTQTIITDYTVTGAGDGAGGTVTTVTSPASGTILTIIREVPLTQLVDYVANDDFPAETHETALDKLTMAVQQLAELDSRCLRFPVTEATSSNAELDSKELRPNTAIQFDANGDLVLVDPDILPLPATLTIGAPTGNATTKTVSITLNVQAGLSKYFKLRVWLVDGTNSTPTLEESLSLPDGISQKSSWNVLTDVNGEHTVSLTHNGASSSWRVCVEATGQVIMSNEITLGV